MKSGTGMPEPPRHEVVGVDERPAKATRHEAADRGLAAGRHPDQHDAVRHATGVP